MIGLIGGTIIAAFMGLVDTSVVTEAPLVHIPQPFYFGAPKFEITSIVMMCIIATVSMVESTGVYLALSDLTGENLTVNASAMVTVQKVQLFYSVVFSIHSHIRDFHKTLVWFVFLVLKHAVQSTTQPCSLLFLDFFPNSVLWRK